MNKLVVVTLAMVLVASMAYAGVASNGLLWAKKSHESSDSSNTGTGSSGHSGDSSGNSNSDNGNDGSKGTPDKETETDKGSDQQQQSPPSIINKPLSSDGFACADSSGCSTDKPITPNPNPNPNPITNPVLPQKNKTPIDFNCHFHPDKCVPDVPGECPGGFASNDNGNCHPIGPCPNGFSRHDDDESGKCFKGPNFCHFHSCGSDNPKHSTTTVVIHKTKVVHKKDLIGIPTVFVPGIGLVEPLNCKLNKDNGKIGCEFVIIKVIN